MSLQPAHEDFVRIYTDGACSGNPGPGGWAFIMEHPASGKRIERAGAEPLTTNNRMEITSALQGLFLLKRPCRVEIITDSQYLAKGIREWLPGWKSNGFRRREGGKLKPLQNEDLWRAVDEELQRHEIQVVHVKGHSGHPENERCDQMAVAAYKRLMAGTLAAANPMNQVVSEIPRTKASKPNTGQSDAVQISDPDFRRPAPQTHDTPAPQFWPEPESASAILQRPSTAKPALKTEKQVEKHQTIETSSDSPAGAGRGLSKPVAEKIADQPEFELAQTELKAPKRRTTSTKKQVDSIESRTVVKELAKPHNSVETAEVPQKVKAVRQRKPKSDVSSSSSEQKVVIASSKGKKASVVEQPAEAEAEQPAVKKRAPRKKKAES